jgi:hypothetical protein
MSEKAKLIDGILVIMRSFWDLPADCNEGELFTYAEELLDRIQSGQKSEALYLWLSKVQTNNLEMPPGDGWREIVDRSVAMVRNSVG